jgi:hypothetical protein
LLNFESLFGNFGNGMIRSLFLLFYPKNENLVQEA